MTFSVEQKLLLDAPLNRANVKTRAQGKKTLSYIEGWMAIAEANRIFGHDRWTRETFDVVCVVDVSRKIGVTDSFAGYDGFGVTYICRVRIIVDGAVLREGSGAGHGIDRDRGLAHESALKEAETDAMKRALMTFGNPFGLALYDKEQRDVVNEADVKRQEQESAAREEYIESVKGTIADIAPDKLRAWWDHDAQKAARRKYNLSPGELEVLKALVIAKLPKRETGGTDGERSAAADDQRDRAVGQEGRSDTTE